MSATNQKWLKELGLNSADFAKVPQGESPLIWGLKNLLVNEQAYTLWACETFQLPALKEEFFSQLANFSVIEKFSQLHSWHGTCFPIYEWNDTLFVACLEPLTLPSETKICYVIAPYSAMTRTWKKYLKGIAPTEMMTGSIPVIELPEIPTVVSGKVPKSPVKEQPAPPPTAKVIEFAKPVEAPAPAPEPQAEATAPEDDYDSLDDLDFSALEALSGKSKIPDELVAESEMIPDEDLDEGFVEPLTEVDVVKPSSEPLFIQGPVPVNEVTQTNPEIDFGNLTSATQTMHFKAEDTEMEDLDLPNLVLFEQEKVTEFSLEDDPSPKPAPKETAKTKSILPNKGKMTVNKVSEKAKSAVTVSEKNKIQAKTPEKPKVPEKKPAAVTAKPAALLDLDIPSLDDLNLQAPKAPAMAAPAVDEVPEFPDLEPSNPGVLLNDDKTPPPQYGEFESDYGKPKIVTELGPPADFKENTITEHEPSVDIPNQFVITDAEMKEVGDIKKCTDIKSIIAFIFQHIKKDYGMLMWVEPTSSSDYVPRFVYGDWQMIQKAWEIPVNLDQPNIFRIAYMSSLPFHGEISDNPINQTYFNAWTKGNKPNFATIFPVCHEDHCYGFVVGFIAGDEFSNTGSLKKLTHLASLSKPSFNKLHKQKAS